MTETFTQNDCIIVDERGASDPSTRASELGLSLSLSSPVILGEGSRLYGFVNTTVVGGVGGVAFTLRGEQAS